MRDSISANRFITELRLATLCVVALFLIAGCVPVGEKFVVVDVPEEVKQFRSSGADLAHFDLPERTKTAPVLFTVGSISFRLDEFQRVGLDEDGLYFVPKNELCQRLRALLIASGNKPVKLAAPGVTVPHEAGDFYVVIQYDFEGPWVMYHGSDSAEVYKAIETRGLGTR